MLLIQFYETNRNSIRWVHRHHQKNYKQLTQTNVCIQEAINKIQCGSVFVLDQYDQQKYLCPSPSCSFHCSWFSVFCGSFSVSYTVPYPHTLLYQQVRFLVSGRILDQLQRILSLSSPYSFKQTLQYLFRLQLCSFPCPPQWVYILLTPRDLLNSMNPLKLLSVFAFFQDTIFSAAVAAV